MNEEFIKVRRHPERASYNKELLLDILHNNFVCNVSFQEMGQPFIIPMAYYSDENFIYLHGSPSSRIISHLREKRKICISVLEINGIVLAKGIADNSINYRSALVFGRATEVERAEEKARMFAEWIERMLPGRLSNSVMPDDDELRSVSVFKIPLRTFSIKVRDSGPIEKRTNPNIWTGVIPIIRIYGKPTYSSGDPPDYIKKIIENKNRIAEDFPIK
ncbi:MAG: pyridoxamine 5'-phosphate oxidase family protein [Thermoplasmatales archaeon]